MNINIIIIIIILILIISIYYFNKERNQLFKTNTEFYNDFCRYDPNKDEETKLDSTELNNYVNKKGHFKLLRDMTVKDLQREIEYEQHKQKRSTDDYASYGVLKSIIESADEDNFRYIQDQYKSNNKLNNKLNNKSNNKSNNTPGSTLKSISNTASDNINENTSDSNKKNILENFETNVIEYRYEQTGKDKKDKKDIKDKEEWKIANHKNFEYRDDSSYPDEDMNDNTINYVKKRARKNLKKELLIKIHNQIDTWLSENNCKQFKSGDKLDHFKKSYHNYMIYKFSNTLKYMPSVDKPIEMTYNELLFYESILKDLPSCDKLMSIYSNDCMPDKCSVQDKNTTTTSVLPSVTEPQVTEPQVTEPQVTATTVTAPVTAPVTEPVTTPVTTPVIISEPKSTINIPKVTSILLSAEESIISIPKDMNTTTKNASKYNNIEYTNSNKKKYSKNKNFELSGSFDIFKRELEIRNNTELQKIKPFDPLFGQCPANNYAKI